MSDRPLDVLEETLGTAAVVGLKDGATYHGRLTGYDQHMNLVLDPPEERDVDDLADAAEEEDGEKTFSGAEVVEDTTIIRGDNVVTITT